MKWDIQSRDWDSLLDEFDEDLFDDAGVDLRALETTLRDDLGPGWRLDITVRVRPAQSGGE